jgi:alpha-tubulin suppressor-like RCC1 family protein
MSARGRLVRCLSVAGLTAATLVAVTSPSLGDSGEAAVAGAAQYQRIVSLGTTHSCAITDAGGVECWGDNQFGQLGSGDHTSSTAPRLVNGISGALELASGTGHTCVLIHGGSVKCWGEDTSGQLGNGDAALTGQDHPVDVTGVSDVKHLVAGDFHTCALRTDGTVWCWGQDGMGQLGDGSPGDYSVVPEPVTGMPAGQTAVDLTAGQWHTCARTVDAADVSRLYCWGHNGFGQLGDNTTTNRSTPVPVLSPEDDTQPMTGVLAATAGAGHTCAILDRTGRPTFCWGQNSYGQLGHKTDDDPSSPAGHDPTLMVPSTRPLRVQYDANADPSVDDPQDLAGARTVSAGANHTCVTLDGGGIDCWGQNGEGQLGFDPRPSTKNRYEDTYLARPAGATGLGVVGGGQHTCAVKQGSLACWGYDFYGQLGGYRAQVPTPTTVTGIRGATRIAVGTHVACVLRTDLPTQPPNTSSPVSPSCWGSNADGRLGIGSTTPASSDLLLPVDLGTSDSAATEIRAGNGTVCAVPTGLARTCWGRNVDGELGDHTTTSRLSPAASTELGSATAYDLGGTFAAGAEHGTGCRASGGHALCWGYNGSGQLGDDTTTPRTTAVTVLYDDDGDSSTPLVPLPGVVDVAVGGDHASALAGDTTVWCWGANGAGQLGDNTTTARHGAVHVQQDTDADTDSPLSGVTALAAGNSHTCALLSTGRVRCWGDTSSGKLGRSGSGEQADQPVRWQTPLLGTVADLDHVTRIVAGDNHTCALRDDPSLVCWGDNSQGQVGAGGSSTGTGLVVLQAPTTSVPAPWIQDVAAGRDNTCAVLLDTTVSCWGDNSQGQVGDGIGARSLSPVTVGGTAGVGANQIPEPPHLSATTTPGVPVDITVPLAGMDPDNGPAPTTLTGVGDPPLGTATTSTASIHYVPDPGCHDDTFAYTVSDSVATVAGQVTVLMNCAPTAVADSLSAAEDTPTDLDVVANDTDPDNDTLSLASTPPRSAHAALSIVAGKVHYVPDADYCGPDSFSYVVSDGNSPPADHTATGTVTVAVSCSQDAPSPGTDAVSTPEDNPVDIAVLANDVDPDGDSLGLVGVSSPAHGTAVVSGAKVTYTPAADYCGPDTFTYRVSDGHSTSTGTVNVSVTCANDSPRAASDSATTSEDTAVDVAVLANDSDPDGDPLSLTGALGTPKHGTVAVVSGKVRYTPAADYCGPDSFTYVVSDGTLTATGQVTMTVGCVNDPPVARADSATTLEDTIVHIHVLTNDSDVDGNPLAIDNAGTATPPEHGTITTTSDSIDYTPAKDYCGTDSFSYDAVDGAGGRSSALVSVTITCVDDPVSLAPVADQTTPWGNAVGVPLSATDPDGPVTFSVVSGPGSVVGSAYQFTPVASDVGVRSVTVRATQGGATSDRTFAVTVTRRATTLTYDGATSGALSDPAVVGATLRDAATSAPVGGAQVGFSMSPASVDAATDSDTGRGTTTIPVSSPVGTRTLQSTFAGTTAWLPSSASSPFTVTKESFTVTFSGVPLVPTASSSATVTLTADLAEDPDGSLAGALGGTSVTFRTVAGTTLCTASASNTTPGAARASCSTTLARGALAIVVTATSASYSGLADVGVETVAATGNGMASGAGRVGADDFGFSAQPVRKGVPAGSIVHVVQSGGSALVVSTSTLSSLSTSCTSSKVCKVTVTAATAGVRQVDLSTGDSISVGTASPTVDAVEPDRYAVAITGAVSRTIGSPASPVVIDFGSIDVG